jgi:hypothetical protein
MNISNKMGGLRLFDEMRSRQVNIVLILSENEIKKATDNFSEIMFFDKQHVATYSSNTTCSQFYHCRDGSQLVT